MDMRPSTFYRFSWILALALATAPCSAQTRNFTPGTHGASRLEYVGEIPVLRLFGSPAEMGEAAGILTGDILRALAPDFVKGFFNLLGLEPGSVQAERQRAKVTECLAGIPGDRRAEMDALAKGAGVDPDLVHMANLLPELLGRTLCSTLYIGSARMSDEAPFVGRNLDYPPIAGLERYSLVVVYHEQGRIPLASFTFPGLVGVLTGLNAKGLFGATMDVMHRASKFRPNEIPRFLYYRDLLGCHQSVEALLAALGPDNLSGGNFMVVDARGGAAVLESTGSGWETRTPKNDILYATNHFVAPALGPPPACERYVSLAERDREMERFTPRYALGMVRMTALGPINIQALTLRPATGRVEFAFGRVPAAQALFHSLTRTCLFGAPPTRSPAGQGTREP